MTTAPVDRLTEPTNDDMMPDLVELILNGNLYSPTYWVNMILANSINVDPLSYTTNYLAGDWQAMQRAAKAIRSLSKYSGDYAREISSAVDETDGNWKGNAAQSARQYFREVSDTADAQVVPLKNIATDIETFAQASYYLAQGICYLIQEIFDTAIAAMIKFIAAKAAEASVWGAAAGAALEASVVYDMFQIIGKWQTALGHFTDIATAAETAIGGMLAGVATVRGKDIPELAATSYDHPGA